MRRLLETFDFELLAINWSNSGNGLDGLILHGLTNEILVLLRCRHLRLTELKKEKKKKEKKNN